MKLKKALTSTLGKIAFFKGELAAVGFAMTSKIKQLYQDNHFHFRNKQNSKPMTNFCFEIRASSDLDEVKVQKKHPKPI